MKISVTQIDARRGFTFVRTLGAEELEGLLDGYLGYHVCSPAQVDMQLALAGKSVSLSGKLNVTLRNQCRRCLDDVEQPLQLDLSLKLLPSTTLTSTEEEVELSEEELDTIFFSNDEIDLHDILRESIILELESYLQCRDDCAGLCDGCGANLNREACRCKSKPIDPRWQGLADLNRS